MKEETTKLHFSGYVLQWLGPAVTLARKAFATAA